MELFHGLFRAEVPSNLGLKQFRTILASVNTNDRHRITMSERYDYFSDKTLARLISSQEFIVSDRILILTLVKVNQSNV